MPCFDLSSGATSIDLFCGAGGLAAGLELAGWQTAATLDANSDCVETLRNTQTLKVRVKEGQQVHLAGTKIVHADISHVRAQDLRPTGAHPRWRPDLLSGGPPCQPFSSAGRMLGLDDPRGRLFQHFARLADELRPRFILFENVSGLVTARTPDGTPGGILRLVQRSFEQIGYACRFQLLNAADYGAPQRRVRLFMIATCDESLPDFPEPTHAYDPKAHLLPRLRWVSMADFLEKHPSPDPLDIVRPTKKHATQLAALQPGTGLRTGGIVEANRPGGHWGYRQDCFLADLTLPARTIRAACTPDWIRLQDGSLRRLRALEWTT